MRKVIMLTLAVLCLALQPMSAQKNHSQKAPLLLGQSVLDKFGTITIDYVNSKLIIKQ